MGPRILVIQHHPASPAGILGERMAARAARVTTLDAQHGIDLPADAETLDGLVILGGAMNAYADDQCRHFPTLLELARRYAAAGRPVLGICLGGQLLARAWGAEVRIGAAPEFGVTPLMLTAATADDPLLGGIEGPACAMQWHDDTFDIPPGAVRLLEGQTCRNQAFRVDGVVWGFQCHFEADRRDMVAWAEFRRDNYGYEDFAARLTAEAAAHGETAEAFGRLISDRWLDRVEARRGAGRVRQD
ncbi:MAG: type 1 glutamine amidotransferase [Geminicoccaceae bacterium]